MSSDDILRIHTRIDAMDGKLDTLVATAAKRDGLCDRCVRMLDQHDKILHGNGQEGHVAQLKELQTRMAKVPGTTGGIGVKGIVAIIGAVGAAIGGALTAALSGIFGS